VRRLGQSAHARHRRLLFAASLLVVLASVTALAFASKRIKAEQAAFYVPTAGRCVPTTLNRSDILPGTPIAVTPLPDSYDALTETQISFLGAPASELSQISVTGSSSGKHAGSLRAYSQGDGASFVPAKPFTAGETVTVRGRLTAGGHTASLAFHFVIAHEDVLPHPKTGTYPGTYNQVQHFRSRPDLTAPSLVVSARSSSSEAGYIFTAPYNGPGAYGPMIFDEAGNLIWFDPMPPETAATNLQVQQLEGKPVLTWWQGYIPPQGFGEGEEIIFNSNYRQVARVHAGNGYKADLHDFHLLGNDTALLTAFSPIDCDLSSLGGPRGGAVTDTLYQEIDLRTGLVRREWHAVDHVPLSASYSSGVTATDEWPFDYFHINSMDQESNGTTLISSRNTWALYELNTASGQITSTIGGKNSSVNMGAGTRTAYQHDATVLPNGEISVFDNGATPAIHPQSRALIESINHTANTASEVTEYEHSKPLSAGSQGNVQLLANGNYFVGWGASPYFSEYSPSGQLLFDAHMHGSYQAYRAYRFAWTGMPLGAPAVAAASEHGKLNVFMSWNGDTRTASWQVLAGSSGKHLSVVAKGPKTGFETTLQAPSGSAYIAVQALDANGNVLGTSKVIRG
jgi:hypothetical protein